MSCDETDPPIPLYDGVGAVGGDGVIVVGSFHSRDKRAHNERNTAPALCRAQPGAGPFRKARILDICNRNYLVLL